MQRRLRQTVFLSSILLGLVGCSVDQPDFPHGDTPTPSPSTTSSCSPAISALTFARGKSVDEQPLIRASFSYKLKCDADIADSSVRLHFTNVDIVKLAEKNGQPVPPGAEAYYEYPADSTYFKYDDDAKTLTIDTVITEDDTSTTFNFEFKLVDSNGYLSNALEEDVVYQDISSSI
jgi:hypothetical protein